MKLMVFQKTFYYLTYAKYREKIFNNVEIKVKKFTLILAITWKQNNIFNSVKNIINKSSYIWLKNIVEQKSCTFDFYNIRLYDIAVVDACSKSAGIHPSYKNIPQQFSKIIPH